MLEQELKLSVEGAFAPTLPARTQRRRRHRGAARARPARHLLRHARPAAGAATASRCATAPARRQDAGWTVKLPVGDGIADGPRRGVASTAAARAVPPAARGPGARPSSAPPASPRWRGCAPAAAAGACTAPTAASWPSSSTTACRCCSAAAWPTASARSRSRAAASTARRWSGSPGIVARDGVGARGADAEARAGARRARARRRPTSSSPQRLAAARPAPRTPCAPRSHAASGGSILNDAAHPPRRGRAAASDAGRDAAAAQRPAHLPRRCSTPTGRAALRDRAEVARRRRSATCATST